jgi:membrane protease YdiL (CAAX protease family)
METRFQFKDFLKVFALAILLYGGFAALFSAVPGAGQIVEELPPVASFVIQYLIQFVILFFPLWIFVVSKYEADLKDFGFQAVPWKSLLKTVSLCYVVYLICSTSISALLTALDLKLPGYDVQQSYLPLFGNDIIGLLVGFFFIAVAAPFLEELLFRGFVYRVFVKTMAPWVGSLLTAILFALAHMQLATFFPLLILGLLLNYSYKKTGSVWTPVALHSLNNIIAFSVDIYLTGPQ